MNRRALQIILIASAVSVFAPVLLYLVTGQVVGILLPCGDTGTVPLAAYGGEMIGISCGFLRAIVTSIITTGATIALVLGVFMLGVADLASQSGSGL